MLSCPMRNTTTEQIKCVTWKEAARAGGKSQLEPTEKMLQVLDLHNKTNNDLDNARERNARGSWSNHMRKLDTHNAKDDSRIMLTDFSAALDLRSRMTDNCSVDNYAELGTHFVVTEAR